MKTTKIKIRNLFGISEQTLDGQSIEITGTNGAGKTSVIDAIRYALTNNSERDFIIKKGENEGEILIETDTGLYINRKKRAGQADYKMVKENNTTITSPESYIRNLFTPLQLDPVKFTQMDKKDQNRIILDLIDFDWDINWIKEKFGEIPEGVNYDQNILQVLNDIQAENGVYFQTRQNVNRDIRNKKAFIADIAKDIPDNYNAEKWENFNIGEKYKELESLRSKNNIIQRAKLFKDSFDNKMRGLEAEKEIAINSLDKEIANERLNISNTIERLKAELKSEESKLAELGLKMQNKLAVINAEHETKVAKLGSDCDTANKYADLPLQDTTSIESEIAEAESMQKHLGEYKRMKGLQDDLKPLIAEAQRLDDQIELARTLPGTILESATIPVKGLTVENGIPLINGLPISNLSEGEQMDLCIDVALSKPNSLQIILIDGAEKFSDENREKIYQKCKEKNLQFIATRTTNSNELEVHYL